MDITYVMWEKVNLQVNVKFAFSAMKIINFSYKNVTN